ncbi:hypothetical protein E1301_Tti018283 [Triplophysa tibetana]|uniref:Uncharacterized protein n=1 Tax=Triplophysa tibetana TaxID=1572043 RepID=A0A5A9NME6_9TELE|nr:hypothetical protein E1301_Tti018283 [Triplophysa tibetana]
MFVPLPVPLVFQRTAPDFGAWRLKSPLQLRSSNSGAVGVDKLTPDPRLSSAPPPRLSSAPSIHAATHLPPYISLRFSKAPFSYRLACCLKFKASLGLTLRQE